MYLETIEITDFISKKVEEMKSKYVGTTFKVTKEELLELLGMCNTISAYGATHFYTLLRLVQPKDTADKALDMFFNDVKDRVVEKINATELQSKKGLQ